MKKLVYILFCLAIISSLPILFALPSQAATTIYVGPGEIYTRIQDAVNAASSGDTIIVRDGIYTEHVDVNKSLTIRSENGANSTIVQAANPDDDVFEISGYINVSISGFTIRGTKQAPFAGIEVWYASVNINNNVFLDNYLAIAIIFSSPSASDTSQIRDNEVSNNAGIVIANSSRTVIVNNRISNSSVSLSASSYNVVSDNIISNSFWAGIHMDNGSAYNTITNNIVSFSAMDGISLSSSSHNSVVNNVVSSNKWGGIALTAQSDDNVIERNQIEHHQTDSESCGIYLQDSNNNQIFLNDLTENATNAHQMRSTNFWNSPEQMTYSHNSNTYTNYLGNYWSDYNGSDANRDGIGDTPYIITVSQQDNYPLMFARYSPPVTHTWDLPYGLDEDPMAVNFYQYPVDAVQITLAEVEGSMPNELVVIWYYGGPTIGWKWFKPGWPESTLTTLEPGKYYIGIVSTATEWEIPSTCSADFIAEPTTGVGITTVQFTDKSTGNVHAWSWDFNNDGIIDSTEQNPTHVYNRNGLYSVSLTITTPTCEDTLTKYNYISITGCHT